MEEDQSLEQFEDAISVEDIREVLSEAAHA